MSSAIISILIIALIISFVVINNLLTQISQLEKNVVENSKIIDNTDNFFNFLLAIHVESLLKLKNVDIRGSFSSDDEVGFVFKSIVEIIEQLKKKMEDLKQ